MRQQLARLLSSFAVAAGTALAATPALAHHVMDGQIPRTFGQGLLSGLGHPVIGPDHFAFIVGIGLLAAIAGFGPLLPVAFVVAMGVGLAVHLAGFGLPGAEILVAASVVLIGIAVAWRHAGRETWLEGGAFAMAGAFHGYALAESIVGAETGALGGYVVGLVTVQAAVALLAWSIARRAGISAPEQRLSPVYARIAGLAIVIVGVAFLVQTAALAAR